MSDPTSILSAHGLTVHFGGVRAVDDVTFELARGEILGVIGPNGAGKTTMFDAISGFVQSTGTVVLDGERISGLTPESRSRHGLGRSFQDARLFPSLTVAETLAVALERHIHSHDVVSTALHLPWVSRAEKRIKVKVEELIGLMGLGAFRDKFINELSTGSRRIVDLAVIMAHEPKVLLLDEPSSGIAQKEAEALGPMLLGLREQTGMSMIVVEHDMPLIQSVSDELLALETGAVLTRGTPAEVLDDPRLVAAYLGTDQSTISRSGALVAVVTHAEHEHEAAAAADVAPTAPKRTPRKRVSPVRKAAPKEAVAKKAATTRTATAKKVSAPVKRTQTAASKAATKQATAKRAVPAKSNGAKKTTKKTAKRTAS